MPLAPLAPPDRRVRQLAERNPGALERDVGGAVVLPRVLEAGAGEHGEEVLARLRGSARMKNRGLRHVEQSQPASRMRLERSTSSP